MIDRDMQMGHALSIYPLSIVQRALHGVRAIAREHKPAVARELRVRVVNPIK